MKSKTPNFKIYLWLFLLYLFLLTLGGIFLITESKITWDQDVVFSYSVAFISIVSFSFNVYNIFTLVSSIKNKNKNILFLSLSEVFSSSYLFLFPFFLDTIFNIFIDSSLWIILLIKIVQLIFTIYLLKKLN